MNRLFRIFILGALALSSTVFVSSYPEFPGVSKSNISNKGTSPEPTNSGFSSTSDAIPVYTYKVVNAYAHDRRAFTQGLVFEGGVLYEGTGLRGRSTLRRVELETGDILQIRELPARFFGEGVTVYGNKIIQIGRAHV